MLFRSLKEAELMKERLGLLQQVDPYTGRYYSQAWIQRNVLRMTDDEIEEMQKEIDMEKEAGYGIPVEVANQAISQQMVGDIEMQQQQGRISVSTNMSSDGNKNVSINADGEAADQLMQILKMAGMAGAHHEHHADVVIAAQPMEAKEYGDTDIEKPEEVLNTPRPDVRGMHRAETVG